MKGICCASDRDLLFAAAAHRTLMLEPGFRAGMVHKGGQYCGGPFGLHLAFWTNPDADGPMKCTHLDHE
jgi:hypothetical protein